MHPLTALRFIDPEIGFGVFASGPIPRGTITYVQDPLDISIDEKRYADLDGALKESVDRYAFIDQDGNRVLCWDHAKYVNHCCRSNTISTGYGFEIAIRDIRAGEQVTDDYGLFNLPYDMDFSCDYPDCRGRVSREDVAGCHAAWDASIVEALKYLDKVPQALLPYLESDVRDRLFSYIAGTSAYVSVRHAQYRTIEADK